MEIKTSIFIDFKIWKEFKKHCIDKNIHMNQKIEELIRKELEK